MTPERWQQIDHVLDAALERESSERTGYLAQVCQGDEALLGEVQALLAHSDQAHTFIESPLLDVAAAALAEKRASSMLGRRLGPYEILALLGSGGMGEVYRSRDTRLGREVAIKILPAHLADNAEALARFEREAKTVAALSHPNILAIHTFATDDGLTYAVMELLQGETLSARLARSALTCHEAMEIGLAIAEGLSAAHAKGVVHRDLKPENIFLTPEGQVKILDFGLARLEPMVWAMAGNAAAETANIPAPSLVMGTPGYMSPEQVRGEIAKAPSDIFSFGCVLFEMLNGQAPFAHLTVAETISATLNEAAPALTAAEVPDELGVLVRRCLEKTPNNRFQSAQLLTAELKSILGEAQKLAAEDLFLNARKSSRRLANKILWALSFLALVTLGGIVAVRSYSGSHGGLLAPGSIRSIAILPFSTPGAMSETELSDGVTESLINGLSQASDLQVIARTTAFKYKGKEQDPKEIQRQLGVDAMVTGRAIQQGDTISIQAELVRISDGSQLWGAHYSRKLTEILVLQEEIAKGLSDILRPRLTAEMRRQVTKRYTDNSDAYQLYNKGRYFWNKRRPEALNKANEYFQQAISLDSNYALAYAGLADSYSLLGMGLGADPTEVVPRARAAASKAIALDETLAEGHTSLGHIKFIHDWDWPAAEKEFNRAIELNPNYETAHHYYALLLSATARHDEAVREMKQALRLDPLSLIINTNLGLIYYRMREYDLALKQLGLTLEMDQAFDAAHSWRGGAFEHKGMNEQAIAEYQLAITLSGRRPGTLAALGHIYGALGRREDAQKVLDELNDLSGRRYVSPVYIALIFAGLGDNDQAFHWLEKAYQERSNSLHALRAEPGWDSLRSDARFADLLRRMNFPH